MPRLIGKRSLRVTRRASPISDESERAVALATQVREGKAPRPPKDSRTRGNYPGPLNDGFGKIIRFCGGAGSRTHVKGPNRNEARRGLTHQTHENRLDRSLPFDPAPSHMIPSNGAESGHKEGTKSRPTSGDLRRRRDHPCGSFIVTMSRPEKLIPSSLEEAVAELKRDPSHPVHARVDGFDVELRVVPSNETHPGVGSRLAAIGPWEGIALDELDRILREGREAGGSAAPPEMP